MYTLIRERVASMYELTYVYNLDEMLKLYDLIMMQRDIEYSRSQKERGVSKCQRQERRSSESL